MDARAEFQAFLDFLHDNGAQLCADSLYGGHRYEPGGYEERRLTDFYEIHVRQSHPSARKQETR